MPQPHRSAQFDPREVHPQALVHAGTECEVLDGRPIEVDLVDPFVRSLVGVGRAHQQHDFVARVDRPIR